MKRNPNKRATEVKKIERQSFALRYGIRLCAIKSKLEQKKIKYCMSLM